MTFFWKSRRENVLYTEKNVAYRLKSPLFSGNKVTSRKARSYEPKTLNKTILPLRKLKSLTISHTQHRTPFLHFHSLPHIKLPNICHQNKGKNRLKKIQQNFLVKIVIQNSCVKFDAFSRRNGSFFSQKRGARKQKC